MERKKRLRNYTWEDYGISRQRYKELQAFCLQYDEKKSKLKYGLNAIRYDGQPKGNMVGHPTERAALENIIYRHDCFLIEEAAVKANPKIWKYILRSVTQGLPYEFIEYDEEQGRIPMGKTEFYGYRKLFYHYLNESKKWGQIERGYVIK